MTCKYNIIGMLLYNSNKNQINDLMSSILSSNSNKDYSNTVVGILPKIEKKESIMRKCLFYKNLSFNNKIFNSSSSSIISHPNIKGKFIINYRIVNYALNSMGQSNNSRKVISLNKISILDTCFNEIYCKYLRPSNYNAKYVGIEDIRLFNFNNELYFIGSYYNSNSKRIQIVSNKFILGGNYNPLFIRPTFKTNLKTEKNWVFFNNNGNLHIIYKWSPLYICKIDYDNKELNLVKSVSNMPTIFNNFRGSSNGVEYDNKIWFIVHQNINITGDINMYVHNWVVFDKNMKLLGYSDSFNFENKLVEYCIGLEVRINGNFVITYSTLDSTSKLGVFSGEYVNSMINNI